MNANKRGRLNPAHITPTLTVVPVTRAIRAALTISFTLLALGGSSAALAAGTCVFSTPTTVFCEGAFTDTVPGIVFAPVADLTLVLGDTAPTSVIPAAGMMGIDAQWGGNVGITSFADITTTGASGIHAYGSSSASVSNDGSITTEVTAPDANAIDISAYGDVSVINNGPITAYSSGVYDVTAVNAYSIDGKVSIDNQAAGSLVANAQDGNAIAVNASAYDGITLGNEGAISATSANGIAVGVIAQTYSGDALVSNSGSITATSVTYQAVGLLASSGKGSTTVNNEGSVVATGGQDQTIGIEAFGETASAVYNTGSVYATSTSGIAVGILAQTVEGDATITNNSSIGVTSGYDAMGLSAVTADGHASATSSGFMQVIGHGGLTDVIAAYSAHGSADASNAGFVISGSYGGSAVGVSAISGDGNATAGNTTGSYLRVVTPGDATDYATGILANTYNGDASASNDGSVYALSSDGVGVGIKVSAAGGDATASNTGSIQALNSLFANVRGIQAISSTGEVSVSNSGSIRAFSNQVLGYPFTITSVLGIGAQSYDGTTVTNTGSISAIGPWKGYGVEAISLYGDVAVTNTASGTIFASGLRAVGIVADVGYGPFQAVVNNAGSIHVSQVNDCSCNPGFITEGVGIAAFSDFAGGVAVTNSGSIIVATQHGGIGISAVTYNNAASVNNSGTISVGTTGYGATSRGIFAKSAYGTVDVVNSGRVSIETGLLTGVGTYAVNQVDGIYGITGRHHNVGYGSGYYGAGDTDITNNGDVVVNATRGNGIYGVAQYGSAIVKNAGHVVVNDTFAGTGIVVKTGIGYSTGLGSAGIDNIGTVQVYGSQDARGLVARVTGGNTVDITNAGDVATASEVGAFGVFARNYTYTGNAINVGNTGSISAVIATTGVYATNTGQNNGQAIGIRTYNYSGVTTVTNAGAILADATTTDQRTASAVGIYTQNGYASHYGDTVITNTGSITASDRSNNGTPYFHAPHGAWAAGINASGTYGNFAITNAGSISATSQSAYFADDGLTTANGILATATVGNSVTRSLSLGDIQITNLADGAISASAETTYGAGSTFATGLSGVVAVGSYGSALTGAGHGISINNAGSVAANAINDVGTTGLANAIGISAVNGSTDGFAHLRNTGTVYATATSPGLATATGMTTTAHDITVALTRSSLVVATANGSSSVARGLFASGTNVSASNLGILKGIATGSGGLAYGAMITSAGDLSFTNTGTIGARAAHAVSVDLTSATSATLINTGSIIAVPTVLNTNGIAVETAAPNAVIQNYGTITGKLRNGAGNFSFTNAAGGIWNAAGISDFGAGNDFFRNVGTIHLSGSTINLGSLGALGSNRFTNAVGGAITVAGTNRIAMGASTPNVFMNNGTLNFQNGVVGDTLAITGDFAGNGTIAMDVSGLHGTSDQLQISGNVLAGSVNRVNLHVLNDPTSAMTLIPLITVGGNSVAGSFVLGTVVQDKSFLDVLVSKIDPGNTSSDVFSLGLTQPTSATTSATGGAAGTLNGGVITAAAFGQKAIGFAESVNGLSNLGTLAASAAPGAQNLMNSQIGTLEERMGAAGQTLKGGVSLWARVFGDSGTVNPSHSAGNFGQGGNFSYDQSNTGQEIGMDVAFTDELKAGLLVAKDQANQHLNDGASGSSRIKGTTGGAYATWISPTGMYLDASFRSMNFTSRLQSAEGQAWVKGHVNAFNLETGKTWTLDNGLQIAPQLQYTWSGVDDVKSDTGTLAGFQAPGDDSSRARLGVMVSKSYIADTGTIWQPYVSVSAVHEFDGNNHYVIDDTFNGETSTHGTSALVAAGINLKVRNLALYGGANWLDGGAMKSFLGGQVGLRYTW